MLAVAVLLALLLAAAVGSLCIVAVRSRLSVAPTLAGRTILVNTRRPDDQTIRGILVAQHVDRLTLREAIYVHQSGDQPVAGLAHIPVESISWIQEIEGSTESKES